MKKKKFMILITLATILIILALGVILFIHQERKSDLFFDYPEKDALTVKICKKDNCEMPIENRFDKLVLKKTYSVLQEYIDKINNDSKKYYNLVNNSTITDNECKEVEDLYYHRYRVDTQFSNYENNRLISVGVQRTTYDLCDNNSFKRKQYEVVLYDKKEDKIISQDDFIKFEKITEEEILKGISNRILELEDEYSININSMPSLDDCVILYGFDGSIYVSFYISELDDYVLGNIRTV